MTLYCTGAARRNFPQSVNSEVEFYVKEWLRNAKDREGGRKRRMKPAAAAAVDMLEDEDDD